MTTIPPLSLKDIIAIWQIEYPHALLAWRHLFDSLTYYYCYYYLFPLPLCAGIQGLTFINTPEAINDLVIFTWQEFQKLWPTQNLLTSVLLFCCWSANFEASDLDEECSGCGSKKVPGEVGTWKQPRPGFMTVDPLGFGLLVQMPCSFWNQMLTS